MAKVTIEIEDNESGISIKMDLGPDFDSKETPTDAQLAAIEVMEQLSFVANEVYEDGQKVKADGKGMH
jgi:hypothetical protein